MNKAFNNLYEENNNETKDKADSNLTNINNNNNEVNLPPPKGVLDYPEKNEIEEKRPKTIDKKISHFKRLSKNKNLKSNAEGIIYYDNGNIYKGQLKNGIRYGQGEIIFFNGYTLKGNFNDKAVNGKVVITYNIKNNEQISNFKLVLDASIPDIDNFDIQSYVKQNID